MAYFQSIANYQFPLPGWIILIHELLERFSFYGMKGILALYLNIYLGFSEDTSTILYHLFTGFSYLSPVLGAIISDNYLGRYKTIVFLGIIYLIGHLLMPLTAIRKNIPGPLIGMCILAIGSGGIKSSVAAFGGDQIPSGNDEMIEKFFSLFYTSVNIGAFVAQFVTPILRSDVSCVDNYCYPLAFGVPAIVFLLTYILFIAGTKTYNIVPKSSNVISKFVHCVYIAIYKYIKERKIKKYTNIMYYAKDDFSDEFINDCRIALRIMIIFVPIPVFWALYDQQGSRWTMQAKNMDGRIGSAYIMKPEQIQAFNSLFIVALIPIFNFVIYPLCNKMNMLIKPTSKLVTSYVVAAISFIISGILQIYIIKGQQINFNMSFSKFTIINTIEGCTLNGVIKRNDVLLKFGNSESYDVTENANYISLSCNNYLNKSFAMNLCFSEKEMKSGIVFMNSDTLMVDMIINNITIKRKDGYGFVRYISTNRLHETDTFSLIINDKKVILTSIYTPIPIGKHDLYCINKINNTSKNVSCGNIIIIPGLMASLTTTSLNNNIIFVEFEPRLIHILWQLPQYILITGAEILCSITSLSFAYSKSPDSLKSLMQAIYLLTIFGGNIIVVFVAVSGSHFGQTVEFFIFALLVLIAGFVNWILIYKFWDLNKVTQDSNLLEEMN